ncbi:MAG: DUF3791 domain-containing protein [Spirochaetaceae bacterium]|nr:DUF3791 domain-containing protein [Spirochaetaceae bacterium]
MSDKNQDEIDANLLVVAAVEGYAYNHNLQEKDAYKALAKKNLLSLVREHYPVLHTQPLEETVAFVEDVMKRS